VKGYQERRRTTNDIELANQVSEEDEVEEEEAVVGNRSTTGNKSNKSRSSRNTPTTTDYYDSSLKALTSLSKPDYISFPLLLSRSFTNLIRQPKLFFTRLYQCLFFGLILGCFYAPIGNDQASVQNRIGNLYELTAICFIGMLNCIDIYPTERNLFYREYLDGIYSSRSFILSYFVIGIPLVAFAAFLLSLLMTYAIGLAPRIEAVFEFTFPIFCFMFVGECLGVLFCSAFQHVGFSLNLVSAVISFFCKFFLFANVILLFDLILTLL
jgi:hypothetical protein